MKANTFRVKVLETETKVIKKPSWFNRNYETITTNTFSEFDVVADYCEERLTLGKPYINFILNDKAMAIVDSSYLFSITLIED